MQHLRLQVLNGEAITGYLTLSVTIKDGTTAAPEVMGNINKGFETLCPRLQVQPLDLSFNHLRDTIQEGAKLGVYVANPNGSAWPKLSSEQARANVLARTYAAGRGGREAAQNTKAKHGNRVICRDCGDLVALKPGTSIKKHRHGRNVKTGELNAACVKRLAELARMAAVKL